MERATLLRKEPTSQELWMLLRTERDTFFANRKRSVSRNWDPKAIGFGFAVVALFSCALVGWQKAGVSANERNTNIQTFLSERTLTLPLQTATVPAGTRIQIRLKDVISTDKNSSGDHFKGSLDGPLIVGAQLLSPSRNKIIGQLAKVEDQDRANGPTRLTMVLNELIVNGNEYTLETEPLTHVQASEGSPVSFGPGSRFTFTLSTPLTLPVIRKMGG